MSATLSATPQALPANGMPALRALARVEAKRFARHPLFLLGVAIMLIPMVAAVWRHEVDANPMVGTLFIAFLIGVFGFIVAHRLTTSTLRTRDLVTTTPVDRQQRTLALCLGRPGARHRRVGRGGLHAGYRGHLDARRGPGQRARRLVPGRLRHRRPRHPRRDGAGRRIGRATARGDRCAMGAVPGSALIGVVTLVFLTALPSESPSPWRLLSAWPILVDEHVNSENGPVVRSNFVPDVTPVWALGYLLCLCGLAVVAALLRDPGHRRPLLATGLALLAGAVGCFLIAVS